MDTNQRIVWLQFWQFTQKVSREQNNNKTQRLRSCKSAISPHERLIQLMLVDWRDFLRLIQHKNNEGKAI